MRKSILVLFGPTAVGKTAFGDELARLLPVEIINADVGQFYTPLSIGTAKPDWRNSQVPQHLFDIINEPASMSMAHFRDRVMHVLDPIWSRNNIPLFIGGSGFYLQSLFFPPQTDSAGVVITDQFACEPERWRQLYEIDPQRAVRIHPHDLYRINRALSIYFVTGTKPSEHEPRYQPVASFCFVSIMRERPDLYQRINQRVNLMLGGGWLAEVEHLLKTPWEDFLINKKIIGYDEIIKYLNRSDSDIDHRQLGQIIACKTRQYAKRQIVFGNYLANRLQKAVLEQSDTRSRCLEFDLTKYHSGLYIKQLLEVVKEMHTIRC